MKDRTYTAAAAYLIAFYSFAFYFTWLASDGGHLSTLWQTDPRVSWRAYSELAQAFLHGQTSLLITPDPALDRAPNPYLGGEVIGAQVIPDLSYFHMPGEKSGHYYAYWGPLPAILLYCPFRAITHHDLSNRLALLILILLQVAVSAAIIERLCSTWFNKVSLSRRLITFVIVTLGSLQPYIAVYPDQYRVSLIMASVCVSLSFLFLICVLSRSNFKNNTLWPGLAAFSFTLALAHMGRATHVLDLLVIPILFLFIYPVSSWKLQMKDYSLYTGIIALCLPPLIPLALTGYYNYVRFDDPFQFGIRYQMNPKIDILYTARFFEVKYFSDGIFDYLISPLVPMDRMPFIAPDHKLFVPSFLHNDRVIDAFTAGIFCCFPITLLGLFWNPLITRSQVQHTGALKLICWMLLLCFFLQLILITSFWSICFRYSQDFLQPLMILTTIALLALSEKPLSRPIFRLWIAGLTIISVVVGFLLGWPDTIFNC